MLNPRSKIADVLRSGSGMRSRTGRLLVALGLASLSPEIASAARKAERRNRDQGGNNEPNQDNSGDSPKRTQSEQEADRKNNSDAGAEDKGTDAKSEKSGKHDRNEEQSGNDASKEQTGADGGKGRGDSQRRNAESDSASRDDSSAEDYSFHRGSREVRRFEQQANEPPGGSLRDNPPLDRVPDATTVTPANPNVFTDDVPDTFLDDLIVQATDNVIATVSTSGGFAFARSGDVIAVSGPDGASIVQTGDVTTGTNGTIPGEPPDDGGNNSPEFVS